MTPAPLPSSSGAPSSAGHSLGWLIAGVALLSFGCMMFVMAAAFARDLRALQNAPALLWSALCGEPVQSELTLPILLATGAVACAAGAASVLIARLRR